jgi:hypothetical protein
VSNCARIELLWFYALMDSVGLIVFVFFCFRMVLFRVQRWLIYGKKKVICNDLVWLFFFFLFLSVWHLEIMSFVFGSFRHTCRRMRCHS